MKQQTIIEPGKSSENYWKDLVGFRGLFYFLAWRDVMVRYKQTSIGVAWSVFKPLLTIIAFTILGWVFNTSSEGTPRLLMVAAATLPWQFFATAFSEIANSLVGNSNLMSKVYFPRLIVPVSTLIVSILDFLISFVLVLLLMFWFEYTPSIRLFALPVFLLLGTFVAIGPGLWIATLNVKYRDFRYIVPFIIQFGLFASPIAFTSQAILASEKLPEWVKLLYSFNPMVTVIEGFRWCIIGGNFHVHSSGFVASILITISFVIFGIWYFRKFEKSFADFI